MTRPVADAQGEGSTVSGLAATMTVVAMGFGYSITAADPPSDVYPNYDGPPPPRSRRLTLSYRSLCCFVAAK